MVVQPDRKPAYQQPDFDNAALQCDVVMKGGITSGVVYPLAVVELAKKYRLKNIGGASAGAIAAGFAAAAEYGRTSGGFLRFAGLADEVSKNLLSLFQPTPALKPFFAALVAGLKPGSLLLRLVRGCTPFLCARWWCALLCATLPCAVLAIFALAGGNRWGTWTAAVLALLLCWCVALLVLVWRTIVQFARELPKNNYGICSGLCGGAVGPPALTDWLADRLDTVADTHGDKPLTFGDLRGDDAEPHINLEVMTTNLTAGRPHRMPFDKQIFHFRENEFRQLFPKRIVDWMVAHSELDKDDGAYRELPDTKDLPVVVAIRMSLSFPVLLAAVPLYARDYTLDSEAERQKLRHCWFSDGGICSNFPIHFFDSLWPRRPTFGITLEPLQTGRAERVTLPTKSRQGILRRFRDVASLWGFVKAILDTMQEWRDNLQSALPGFRDRIVHVALDDHEGGMNLDMPPELVQALSGYGRAAGEKLRDEFDWPDHRRVRFLVSMAKLQSVLAGMRRCYEEGENGDENLHDLLARLPFSAPPYEQLATWRHAATHDVEALLACAAQWEQFAVDKIPKPDTDLRITPRP